MFSVVWAQDTVNAVAGAPANDIQAMVMSALPFVLVLGIFYFVLVRPQMQQAKKHATLLEGLKKGDVVVTDGGLIGEIAGVNKNVIQLRVNDSALLSVAREAVRTILEGDAAKSWEPKAKVADAMVKRK